MACLLVGRASVHQMSQGSADAVAVPGGVAPGAGQGPGALQEEVQVVLDRVADGAVALERLAADELGGVGRHRLGHRHVAARASASSWASDHAARCTAGRANSSARAASARWCFTAWNSRSARRTAGARSRSRRSGRASPGRGRRAARRCRARPRSSGQLDGGGVVGDERRRRRRGSTGAARRPRSTVSTGVERRPSARSTTHERRAARAAAAGRRRPRTARSAPPRSVATMPAPRAEQRRRDHAVSTIGSGSATRPVSSRISTRNVSSSPSPPSASGTSSAEHAHLVEAVPHAAVELAGRRVPRGAHDGRRALLGEQVAHRVAERRAGRRDEARTSSAGSPRTRSAAMLRWISLVPA